MITSFIEGRIRIRDEALKTDSISASIKSRLLKVKGVSGVEANTKVGSILIVYDNSTDISEVMSALKNYIKISKTSPEKALRVRKGTIKKAVNTGMLASLMISLIGAAFDIKKLHITTGIIFLGFLGSHLVKFDGILKGERKVSPLQV